MDGSKATRVLDFEYRPMRQTVIDMYEDLQGRRDKYGWSSNESEATFTSKSARGCASGLTAFFHSVLGQRSIKLEGDEKSLSTSAEKHHV